MKKILKIASVLLLAIFVYTYHDIHIQAANGSENADSNSHTSLTHNGITRYYEGFNAALDAAQSGDTIKFLDEKQGITKDTVLNKNLTIDCDEYQAEVVNFFVKDGAQITFTAKHGGTYNELGGLYNTEKENSILIIVEGSVIFDGVRVFNNGWYDQYLQFPMIQVGQNNSAKKAELTVQKDSFILSYQTAIHTYGSNAKVNIKSAELLEGHSYAIAMSGDGNIVNIEGGDKINGPDYASISAHNESKNAQINISGGNIISSVWVYGTKPHFTMTSGKVNGHYGLQVGGTDAIVDLKGGEVSGGYGGVFGYGLAKNTTINVDGGTVKAVNIYDFDEKATGFYLEGESNLNVNKGLIEGENGIVIANGTVKITGGVINATGTGSGPILWDTSESTFDGGIPVIINSTKNPAKATITGGTFNSNHEKSLLSYTNQATDYQVTGGVYNKPFDKQFVADNYLEVKINDGDKDLWYVGDDATEALEKAKKEATNAVEVLTGDVQISDAVKGFSVKNSGDGNVSVNNETVANGDTVIVSNSHVEKISFNKNVLYLKKGNSERLIVKKYPEDAIEELTYEFKSGSNGIATVDRSGTVQANEVGNTTITASANGLEAKCQVVVDNFVKGDLSRNDKVEIIDATEALLRAIETTPTISEDLNIADFDGNNKIDASDATEILLLYINQP